MGFPFQSVEPPMVLRWLPKPWAMLTSIAHKRWTDEFT